MGVLSVRRVRHASARHLHRPHAERGASTWRTKLPEEGVEERCKRRVGTTHLSSPWFRPFLRCAQINPPVDQFYYYSHMVAVLSGYGKLEGLRLEMHSKGPWAQVRPPLPDHARPLQSSRLHLASLDPCPRCEQFGFGANGKDPSFGFSTWMGAKYFSQPHLWVNEVQQHGSDIAEGLGICHLNETQVQQRHFDFNMRIIEPGKQGPVLVAVCVAGS